MNNSLHEKEFKYDSIEAGYYDSVYRKFSGVQSKWHVLKFARIRSELGEFSRHLDIGCGPGTLIGSVEEKVLSVGVDIAKIQILYAKKKYGTPKKQFLPIADDRLPFGNACFDVVTVVELIEHLSIDQIQKLLKEIYRILEPGGKCLVTTPNYGGLWPLLEWLVNRRGKINYEHQHISHFTESRLHRLMNEAGYEQVVVEGFQGSAFAFAALNWRLADYINKLPVSLIDFLLMAKGVKSK